MLSLFHCFISICNDTAAVPAWSWVCFPLSKKLGERQSTEVRKTPQRACYLFLLEYLLGIEMCEEISRLFWEDAIRLRGPGLKAQHAAFTVRPGWISGIPEAAFWNFLWYLMKPLMHTYISVWLILLHVIYPSLKLIKYLKFLPI